MSDCIYRMPTYFGTSPGPRWKRDDKRFDNDKRRFTEIGVSFLTRAEQLAPMLPPGFCLDGEPIVTVKCTYMTEIAWLAGRGYNVLGVTIPVRYQGGNDVARGPLVLVLWENLTDPILTGREEVGFPKIYADIPDAVVYDDSAHVTASWMGFRFAEVSLMEMQEVTEPSWPETGNTVEAKSKSELNGMLCYKYVPKTGNRGTAHIEHATISYLPSTDHMTLLESFVGTGQVRFNKARWEDLPTQHHIVDAFASLDVLEYRDAQMLRYKSNGGLVDVHDMHVLT